MPTSSPVLAKPSRQLGLYLGNLAIGLGVMLLLGVTAFWSYSQYVASLAERERQEFLRALPTPVSSPATSSVPTLAAERRPGVAAPVPPPAQPAPAPEAMPATGVPAWQTAAPSLRVTIPSIDVDTKVVSADVKGGSWEVPKFVAGHLEGTARPSLGGGNVVLSGHLQSLTSGNAFARLSELTAGDLVVLQTIEGRYAYEVSAVRLVPPQAVEVTFPTEEPEVTLITCAGEWDPIARDYAQRLVVSGKLTRVNEDLGDSTTLPRP